MIITCRHASPILEPAKHDLDAAASFVAALVIRRGNVALLSTRGAGAYPFVAAMLAAVRCAFSWGASIATGFSLSRPAAGPTIIRAKIAFSLQRFHWL
ncbi:hypothetical protein RA27_10945 [Ruegeria sp. ANG-R]|nr:hypothetical protein RA27_10945 [Ruegeria sp. ANG-R]